jgi:hypothetical protein
LHGISDRLLGNVQNIVNRVDDGYLLTTNGS